MKLFDKIPDNFFTVLTSKNRELYIESLFVIRSAFRTELIMKRSDVVAMLIDSIEELISISDLSDELTEEDEEGDLNELSGKAYSILRRLKCTGWISTEYEKNSFEESITVPDYSIQIINVLYDLCVEKQKEYNSYVFQTYSTLKTASEENSDYLYHAMATAYKNTVDLVDELKTLFNNIKRYQQKITDSLSVNELLEQHFDQYKSKIIDAVYYPLKTIDSVPRFKNAIITILNEWLLDDEKEKRIIQQGVQAHIYESEDQARSDMIEKINYIIDTYESIEELISSIDGKHVEYTNAAIDKIRYKLNSDQSIKGKLIEILQRAETDEVSELMEDQIITYRQSYMDQQSMFQRLKRDKRKEGRPLSIIPKSDNKELVDRFLSEVKNQYSSKKVDEFILSLFQEGIKEVSTKTISIQTDQDFILLLLGTIRATEKRVLYSVDFSDEYIMNAGYRIPLAMFIRRD